MLVYVCPEDNGIQRDWYYHTLRKMFVRCDKQANIDRRLYGRYLTSPDTVREQMKREPSSATIAMWAFWQKVRWEA